MILWGGANKKYTLGTTPLAGNAELKALATGLLKNTTTTGALSIASEGTDYLPVPATPATGVIYQYGASAWDKSAFTLAAPGAFGAILASDGTNWIRQPNPAVNTLTAAGANSIALGTGSSAAGSAIFKNATNANAFTITSGVSGANIGWTLPTAAPAGNGYLVTSSTAGVLTYTDPSTLGGGATAFTDLSDVPASYSGAGGQYVKVNSGATALEFVAGGGGAFTDLSDVPSSYAGQAGKMLKVNTGEDALEFVSVPTIDADSSHFMDGSGTFRALGSSDIPNNAADTSGTAAHGTTWGAYAAISGPSQARTFTLPNADATILYSGGALGTPASGTLTNCSGGTQSLRLPHSFIFSGEVTGTTTSPGFYISLPTGQTAKMVMCRHSIDSGTSVAAKITINGSDATGFTGISITATPTTTNPADVTLSDNDFIQVELSSPSGSPTDVSFTIFVDYTK